MRKNLFVKNSIASDCFCSAPALDIQHTAVAGPLMNPARYQNNYYRAQNRCRYYRPPLLPKYAQTVHNADSGRHKEETEIVDQKIGHALYLAQFHDTGFERRRKSDHTDYARRQRTAREPYNKLTKSKKGE